jgi:hypothetical protein
LQWLLTITLPLEANLETSHALLSDCLSCPLRVSQWAQIDVRTVGRDRATNLRVAQELGSSPIGMRCRAHVAQGSDMAPWWTLGF